MMVATATTTVTVSGSSSSDPSPPPNAASSAGDQLCNAVRQSDLDRITSICSIVPGTLRDAAGHTALHWAAMNATPTVLLHLLKLTCHPVDVVSLAPEQLGQTALHWAVVGGSVRCVGALLQAGASPSACDSRGYSAVIHAAQYGRVDIAHLLLLAQPALVEQADRDGRVPLHWAAHAGSHPMVSYLLDVALPASTVDPSDAGGQTPLHKAVSRGHVLVARTLLNAGADKDSEDADGKTPIARAFGPAWHELKNWNSVKKQGLAARLRGHGLVLFYYATLVVSYWFYVRYMEWNAPRSSEYSLAFNLFALAALVSHSWATYSDPGELPPGSPESCRKDIERALAAGVGEVALGPSKYCFTCLRHRVPRSKHSKSRGRCVRVFDHECPWINNAVGVRNHRPLLVFAACMLSVQSLFLDQLREALFNDIAVKSVWDALKRRPLAVGLGTLHIALAAFCAVLLLQHLVLAGKGLTTFEQIAYKRLRMQRNPHDFGVWRNICNFLTASGPGTENFSAERAPRLPAQVQKSDESTLSDVVVHSNRRTTDKEEVGGDEESEETVTRQLID